MLLMRCICVKGWDELTELRILFIGDIVGKPGRNAVQGLLGGVKEEHGIGFTVANGENAAGGMGLTPVIARICSAWASTS